MTDDIKINLVRPFGPSILSAKIPDSIVNEINNYVDQIIINEEKSSENEERRSISFNAKIDEDIYNVYGG